MNMKYILEKVMIEPNLETCEEFNWVIEERKSLSVEEKHTSKTWHQAKAWTIWRIASCLF